MFFVKTRIKKSLEANDLIHDAIVMGVADKYILEENLGNEDFGLQLLGRALNWAIPNRNYELGDDIAKVENQEFRKKFLQDEDQIYKKGLEILNADSLIEKLATHNVVYHIYLLNKLYHKDAEKHCPGMTRMRKFTAQTLKRPDVEAANFKDDYKTLFVQFNDTYGKYGKTLKKETVDALFSLIMIPV